MRSRVRSFASKVAFVGVSCAFASLNGCGGPSSDSEASADALNYRSTAGQEYELSTVVTFTVADMPDGLTPAEREKEVLSRADKITTKVMKETSDQLDKVWTEDERTASKAGITLLFRQSTSTMRNLKPIGDGSVYQMTVAGEFAASTGFEKRLPLQTVGGETFLPINMNLWDGSGNVDLRIAIKPIERSHNAYPKYLDLFKDGLDISIHVGGDHHTPPSDIAHARSIYDDLVDDGFRSPVRQFAKLTVESAPLTKTIRVKGADIQVRVRLFHVDMTTPETRSKLVEAYKSSMKTADVVIYDGHAGRELAYSGIVVAYKPERVALPAADFKSIESTQKQQIYFFNGCETYSGYADKLYENPNRTPENTDIITSVNFTAIMASANQVLAFVHGIIDSNDGGDWVPRSWDSVLRRVNNVGERAWVHVYGAHGIDDNPKISPFADLSKLGANCEADSNCGAPDSRCLPVSAQKVCGVACADSAGCPRNTKCVRPKDAASEDDERQCVAQ